MFDIGFQELVLIAVVALLVIGPERMPGLARKAGLWIGKARRFVSSVKEDIDRELAADQLKKIMEEQKKSVGLHDIIEETRDTIDDAKKEYLVKNTDAVQDEADALKKSVDDLNSNDRPGKS